MPNKIIIGKLLLSTGLVVALLSGVSFLFTIDTDYSIFSWAGLILGFVVENIGFFLFDKYQTDLKDKGKWSTVLFVSAGIFMILGTIFVAKYFQM